MSMPYGYAKMVMLVLLLLLYLGACAVEHGKIYVVDGKRYCVANGIWRNKWWQHYERGQSCAAGGFWDEAIGSFKAALAATRGQKDRWYVNTYGVNFIDDYFPHRELGIAYYQVGRDDKAQGELKRSLRMTPSAKAKFYLNEVRRRLIRQAQRDKAAPRIVLNSPLDGWLTNGLTIDVTGYAEDDTFVESLVINGQELFIELAEPHLSFTREIRLQDGSNRIAIVVMDLAGRQTQQHITVHLDRRGPSLSLQNVVHLGEPSQSVRVQGSLSDQSTIKRVELAGQRIPLSPGMAGTFDEEIDVQPGMKSLVFEAEDAAGNITRGEIALVSESRTSPGVREGKQYLPGLLRRAALHSNPVVTDLTPASFMTAQTEGRRRSREKVRPVIELAGRDVVGGSGECRTQGPIVVYEDRAVLEIKATDESGITTFTIDGAPLQHRQGIQLYFTEIVPLQFATTNRFHLAAVDVWGNTTECEIEVRHEIRKVRRLDYRLKVIQEPLQTKKEICQPTALTAFVDEFLLNSFKMAKRFHISIGEKKNIKDAEVDGFIRGKVCEGKIKEEVTSFQVIAEFMEADSGASNFPDENAIIESVYDEDLTPQRVQNLMNALALKLLRHFPLEAGNITEIKGKKVVTNLSRAQAVRPRMKLVVYREERIQNPNHRTASEQEILGEAQLIDVFEKFSEARLLSDNASGDIQPNDKVITK